MGRTNALRILLIGDYPPPMGGIAVHVQQLYRAFDREGLTCRVLDISKAEGFGRDIIGGRGYRSFSRELLRHASAGWLLHLHTSGNNPKAWTVAMAVAVAGQMFRTPTLITAHSGLIPQRFPRRPELRRRAKLALLGYSHVVTVSEAVRETLLGLGLSRDRCSVFPAFCPGEVIPGAPPEQLAPVRQRRRPLLSVAHHPSPVYGRRLVFEALSVLAPRHPGIGLALFGPGTGSPEYRADAERFGVTALLEDFGELEHERALALIKASDVFVRPTTADGDSVSVREALTLGVPCVATDVAVRPAGTHVCRGADAADLATNIEEALQTTPVPMPQPDTVVFLRRLYEQLRPMARRDDAVEPRASGLLH
ncbi:MAG: glycosyltransferase family 4 protein [Myxococcaceae bacterium]